MWSQYFSEGILSLVEYAPRLLIVLPSRQFRAWHYAFSNDKKGQNSKIPKFISRKSSKIPNFFCQEFERFVEDPLTIGKKLEKVFLGDF